jgi:hypothetical protein
MWRANPATVTPNRRPMLLRVSNRVSVEFSAIALVIKLNTATGVMYMMYPISHRITAKVCKKKPCDWRIGCRNFFPRKQYIDAPL